MATPIAADLQFSPARGGPFYRWLGRTGYLRSREGTARTCLFGVLVAWLPMIAFALIERVRTGVLDPIVFDAAVHVRVLVAIPLLFISEAILDERCTVAMERFVDGKLTYEMDRVRVIVRDVVRFRDASLPEAGLLTLALARGNEVAWASNAQFALLSGPGDAVPSVIHAARFWYGLVALPLFIFLLLRTVWSWLMWTRVLWGLSRTALRPSPLHPDHAGGLGMLAEPSSAFAFAVSAGSAAIAGSWSAEVRAGKPIATFAASFVELCLFAFVLGLGPLLFFSDSLLRARLAGLREYGQFALVFTRQFHKHWAGRSGESLLGIPDISSLADLGTSYENLTRMRLVPFGQRAMVILLAAALVPMLPLLMLQVPVYEIFERVGRALLGGIPP